MYLFHESCNLKLNEVLRRTNSIKKVLLTISIKKIEKNDNNHKKKWPL